MSVDKFIKVQKQGDIYYYKCPNNTMSGQSCFISMRSNLNRELYYALPSDSVLVDCNEATTTTPTTQPTTTLPCDIQFQSLGFVNNESFPYDYTLSKGYIQVVMTTLARNPSYQFQILSGTTVVMDWTDPISTFNTFYFKVNCANYTVKARDFYNQSCVININNISVPCLIQPTTTTNPSCNNGSTPFNIISTNYSNNQLTYIYDAQNLVNATWVIRTGTQILFNGTVTHTSSTKTLTNVPLSNGNYTFELTGTSCVGTATKNFSVTDSTTTTVPTTVQSCNPVGGVFSIISVTYNSVANEINYIYDAQNLVNATWQITSNGNVIQTGSVRHLSSNITIPLVAPLPNGTYNFNLTGVTCSGTASKSFGVSTTTTSTTTTTVPTTTTSSTTSTTTTSTTTVPTWNPCSVYSLEYKYVDSTESGHPKRETKVLINNYNQFTNTYLYYGEILLSSSLDYTNNGFSTTSYYKFISSTSLNNVGYTLLYDPNVNHDYVISSYNLTTKTVIETKGLVFNNRGITNTHPNESEIRSITIDNSGNLYCASKFGIDKYVISGSNWIFNKNVAPPSYNTALTGGLTWNLPNNSYYLLKSSMNYIPNLDAIVWSNHGDLALMCYLGGTCRVDQLYETFNNVALNTFVKDNYLYLTSSISGNNNRSSYNYTHIDGTIRTSLVSKLDINDLNKNVYINVGTLSTQFDNLPIQKDDYPNYLVTNDFVQSMACKNLYVQNQFSISEPTLTCYTSTITANFIIYGGSDNYEISLDGGTSWTHYSDADVTITLPRTTHTTILGYEVYLVRIKNNDTNIIHNFYISNTTNCQ